MAILTWQWGLKLILFLPQTKTANKGGCRLQQQEKPTKFVFEYYLCERKHSLCFPVWRCDPKNRDQQKGHVNQQPMKAKAMDMLTNQRLTLPTWSDPSLLLLSTSFQSWCRRPEGVVSPELTKVCHIIRLLFLICAKGRLQKKVITITFGGRGGSFITFFFGLKMFFKQF